MTFSDPSRQLPIIAQDVPTPSRILIDLDPDSEDGSENGDYDDDDDDGDYNFGDESGDGNDDIGVAIGDIAIGPYAGGGKYKLFGVSDPQYLVFINIFIAINIHINITITVNININIHINIHVGF